MSFSCFCFDTRKNFTEVERNPNYETKEAPTAQQTNLRCDNVVTTLCFGCDNVVNERCDNVKM